MINIDPRVYDSLLRLLEAQCGVKFTFMAISDSNSVLYGLDGKVSLEISVLKRKFSGEGINSRNEINFFPFPSISNCRMLICTDFRCRLNAYQFLKPYKIRQLWRRYFLFLYSILGFSDYRITVKAFTQDLLETKGNIYTGVNDGKRSLTFMMIGESSVEYVKIPFEQQDLKGGSEMSGMMLLRKRTDESIVLPMIRCIESWGNVESVSSLAYSRPYNHLLDFTKIVKLLRLLAGNIKTEVRSFGGNVDYALRRDRKILLASCHGDFTPWNFYICKGRLALFDFETVREYDLVGRDFISYVLSQLSWYSKFPMSRVVKDFIMIYAPLNNMKREDWILQLQSALEIEYLKRELETVSMQLFVRNLAEYLRNELEYVGNS